MKNLYSYCELSIIGFSIPEPAAPDFGDVFGSVGSSIGIAIVAFAISVSMAQLFAKKHDYEVDSNQVMDLRS